MEICSEFIESQNDNLRIAGTTTMFNFSVLLLTKNHAAAKVQALSILLENMKVEKNEKVIELGLSCLANLVSEHKYTNKQ